MIMDDICFSGVAPETGVHQVEMRIYHFYIENAFMSFC